MKRSFRTLSHLLIPVLCCCLIITTLTGIIFGLSDRLLSLPLLNTDSLMAIHRGAFLGNKLSSLYMLFLGLGVFFLGFRTVIGGQNNFLLRSAPPIVASICRVTVLILMIPIAVCVETGVAYHLGTNWFNIAESHTTSFLGIHSGIFLGKIPSIGYMIATSLGLILLSILSWEGGQDLRQQGLQKNIKHSFRQAYLAQDFVPEKNEHHASKLNLAIIYGLIVVLSLLFWLTSGIVVAIAIVLITLGFFCWKKFSVGWQNSTTPKTPTKYEQEREYESESMTMLRAIPDSMLRVTRDGICLSYIPAKEASHFVLNGDIVDKHISEFVAPEIATGLLNTAQVSLHTGKTQLFQFPICVDNQSKPYEARITNMGQTEVLILVREINLQRTIATDLTKVEEVTVASIKLHTEAELLEIIEVIAEDIEPDQHNKILVCLAINGDQVDTQNLSTKEDLLYQAATLIDSTFPLSLIFLLEDNIVLLVENSTIEQVSALVNELHQHLQQFFSVGKDDSYSLEFKIGLLEIDPHGSDTTSPASFAIAMVNAAKATCRMAKQKVNLKTFW